MLTFRAYDHRIQNIDGVIAALGAENFGSVTRSTIPLLDYWRDPERRLAHLGQAIGVQLVPDADLAFEFAVPVAQGQGKASFTDLMITTSTAAVAIEAKYTESRYETVGDWLGTAPTPNRQAVLAGWLGHIGKAAGRPVDAASVHHLPYQVIHRTAALCSVPQSTRILLYQVFGETPGAYYADDLQQLRQLLATDATLAFYLMACPLQRLPRAEALVALSKDDPERATRVRDALRKGPLFAFGEPIFQAVRASVG